MKDKVNLTLVINKHWKLKGFNRNKKATNLLMQIKFANKKVDAASGEYDPVSEVL